MAEISRLRRYIQIAAFVAGGVAVLTAFGVFWQGLKALVELNGVESQRDGWQRPADVLNALELKQGSVVIDLGSGAGYFALKLSRAVGGRGRVVALDVRRVPLLFLHIRALLRNQRNVWVVHGRAEEPAVGDGTADAALLANTYHELANPQAVLYHVRRSLLPGGRLVILDRGLSPGDAESHDGRLVHHVAAADVQDELVRAGFEVLRCDDHFVRRAGEASWWLVVARKGGAMAGPKGIDFRERVRP